LKKAWQAVLYIMIGLFAAGILWLASSLPRGEPITLHPPPTAAPILVHLVGEVKQPGVYLLPRNAHLQDVIQAAGGLTENADSEAVNLAALLQDGQQIRIPAMPSPPSDSQAEDEIDLAGRSPGAVNLLININTAALEVLETLPGIGPAIAQKIIDYRQLEGEFTSIEEIQKVPGIGPEKFKNIKDLITVSSP
jgi:competence protein ComEA